jgi:hypothetical protein
MGDSGMSDAFIGLGCLLGVIVAVTWAWASHMGEKGLYPDDIDIRMSKRWNDRKRQNQCIYCGKPLGKWIDPGQRLAEFVCPACPPFTPESDVY